MHSLCCACCLSLATRYSSHGWSIEGLVCRPNHFSTEEEQYNPIGCIRRRPPAPRQSPPPGEERAGVRDPAPCTALGSSDCARPTPSSPAQHRGHCSVSSRGEWVGRHSAVCVSRQSRELRVEGRSPWNPPSTTPQRGGKRTKGGGCVVGHAVG